MPEPRVHVDFNDIEEDGRLGGLTRNADDPSALQRGTRVVLWDEEGNSAEGLVAELGDRDLVWFEVVPDTWRSWHENSVDSPDHEYPVPSRDAVMIYIWSAWAAGGIVVLGGVGSGKSLTMLHALGALHAARFEDYYGQSMVTGVAPTAAGVGAK
jgi:hypothetical protein